MTAVSQETFGALLGVRQLANGGVLVNDAARRQLWLLDSTLTHATVVLDSTHGATNSYPNQLSPLVAYRADSSLLVDRTALALLVLGPAGTLVRTMALPMTDVSSLTESAFAADAHGRLLFRWRSLELHGAGASLSTVDPQHADSLRLLRADFDTRTIDTIAYIADFRGVTVAMSRDANGRITNRVTVDPLPPGDEWAALPDGSIAIVRGRDYHIDWIDPDGSSRSSPRMPFDWRRVTDEEKQRLADSARARNEHPFGRADRATGGRAAVSGGGSGRVNNPDPSPGGTVVEVVSKPLAQIFDYYPPIRSGAVRADADGNVWVLPTTSLQFTDGALVYDVINIHGELFERIRVPAGRSIAGFGLGGVVYLMVGDFRHGFVLERTRAVHLSR